MSKRYADRNALDSVDLVALPGQMHGLLGPNGAGKTTLIRLVWDSSTRRRHAAFCSATTWLRWTDHYQTRSPVSPKLQLFILYLSARKNLALLARLDGHRGSPRSNVDSALKEVGLGADADLSVVAYSAGMRQRLGIAAALLRSPRLLFLDEPTSSLDPAGARDVRSLARRLANDGAAVVLSSHDLTEVEQLCTAITVINHGRVAFSGTVDELRARAPAAVHGMHTSNNRVAAAIGMAAARRESDAGRRRRHRSVGRHRGARRLRHRTWMRRDRRSRSGTPPGSLESSRSSS